MTHTVCNSCICADSQVKPATSPATFACTATETATDQVGRQSIRLSSSAKRPLLNQLLPLASAKFRSLFFCAASAFLKAHARNGFTPLSSLDFSQNSSLSYRMWHQSCQGCLVLIRYAKDVSGVCGRCNLEGYMHRTIKLRKWKDNWKNWKEINSRNHSKTKKPSL